MIFEETNWDIEIREGKFFEIPRKEHVFCGILNCVYDELFSAGSKGELVRLIFQGEKRISEFEDDLLIEGDKSVSLHSQMGNSLLFDKDRHFE